MTAIVDPGSLAVGAAVREQAIHEFEPGRKRPGRLRIEVEYGSDPAHAPNPFQPEACGSLAAARKETVTTGRGRPRYCAGARPPPSRSHLRPLPRLEAPCRLPPPRG